jgi:SAM-dependent methyltransferase
MPGSSADSRSAARFERTDLWDQPLNEWHAQLLRHLLAIVPEGTETLLDVGCGNGNLLHALDKVPRRIGVDAAKRGVAHLRVPGLVASAGALPFADRSIDTVVCAEVLEHLEGDVMHRALAELKRVARTTLIVSVPNRERRARNEVRCPSCHRIFNAYGHLRSFDEEALSSLLADFGPPSFTYEGKQRATSAWLMRLRGRGLGRWFHDPDMVCPGCGATDFTDHSRDLIFRLAETVNKALHPFATWRYWTIATCRRP